MQKPSDILSTIEKKNKTEFARRQDLEFARRQETVSNKMKSPKEM